MQVRQLNLIAKTLVLKLIHSALIDYLSLVIKNLTSGRHTHFLVMIQSTNYKMSVNTICVCSALVDGHLSARSVVPGTWQIAVLTHSPKEEMLREKNRQCIQCFICNLFHKFVSSLYSSCSKCGYSRYHNLCEHTHFHHNLGGLSNSDSSSAQRCGQRRK